MSADDDELRRALELVSNRFDFGEYEARAYLTIIQHGELTAAEIAERADIPQPRVYDTVRDLSDTGLVELQESRPMRVLAIDPEDAFDEIRSSLDSLVSQLHERYTAPARRMEAVSLVKSRSTILRYFTDVIEAAEYELLVSLTPNLLDRFERSLAARRDAGVATELLVSPAVEAPAPDVFDYASVAVAARGRRGITTPIMAVADGTYSIFATQEALGRDNDRYGVIFNRSELGFLVSGFFNTVLWTTAETIVEDGEDPVFPRRYATIRRCISDLSDIDGEFYATIEGRDIETGATRIVEGRILDASIDAGREVATLAIETEHGVVEVGGQVAALEDVEAHEIRVGRDQPPGLGDASG